MNKQKFTYLLTNPERLGDDDTVAMNDIVIKYPYFQPARALHLKGLKTKESFKYNQELKITAAYTTDRSILFDFITSEAFNQNEISKLIKQNTELLKVSEIKDTSDALANNSANIDDAINQYLKDSEEVSDPELFQQKTSIQSIFEEEIKTQADSETIKNIPSSPEEQLKLGQPLDFDKNENHSFGEWLKITSFKPIQRTAKETPEKAISTAPITSSETAPAAALEKKLGLIDRFLSTNPKISPVKEITPSINLAQTKLVQNDSLMTETLARIYLEQKNYEKAIQSYKILSLKYPEKSGFFADQIKAVKQIQQNNTK